MSDTPGTDAGWRIDPADPTLYRYFDGTAWTDHTAPVAQPYAGTSAVPAGPPRTLSVVSMVLALSSVLVALLLTVVGLAMAITAIVLGILAVRREPHAKAFWLTGIIVGGAVVLLSVGGFIALIVWATWATSTGTFGV